MTVTLTTETCWAIMGGIYLLAICAILAIHTVRTQQRAHETNRWQQQALASFAGALAPIWLALFVLVLYLIARLVTSIPDTSDFPTPLVPTGQTAQSLHSFNLRWHILAFVGLLTALGGLISLPLALLRVMTTERQVKAQEEGLITDRINKAVEGLGTDKTVKKQRIDSSGNPVFANDSAGKPDRSRPVWDDTTEPNLEVRIGALFALERISQDSDRDHIQIMEILCAYIVQNADQSHIALPKGDDPTPQDWQDWAKANPAVRPRADIDVALRIIERRDASRKQIEKGRQYRLDFQHANFRCLVLSDRELTSADLGWAQLQGANLSFAQLQGADLRRAQLQGADLWFAQLQGADLRDAQLQGADLAYAQLQGANLGRAQLQGADLSWTQLQGADLEWAKLDENTSFDPASLRGAGLSYVNLSMLTLDQRQVDHSFGDSGVILPDGIERPDHWHPADAGPLSWLDDGENSFHTAWRAWQKSIGFDPDDSSTWDDPDD